MDKIFMYFGGTDRATTINSPRFKALVKNIGELHTKVLGVAIVPSGVIMVTKKSILNFSLSHGALLITKEVRIYRPGR